MAQSRPNIILILTDQQRGDCLGIDPHSPDCLQTPNLDYLARRGTTFHHGYAECPSCIPARRCIMTGTAPAANGMVGFIGSNWNPSHTLAGELGKAGYQTEMIGKLHLQPPRHRFGFDRVQLADATRGKDNEYVEWLRDYHHLHDVDPGMAHGVASNGWVGRPHHLPETQTHTYWVIEQALRFLQRRDPTVPFFLNLSFIEPHPPLTPPAFYYDRYINRQLPPPQIGDWVRQWDKPERGLNPNAAEMRLPEHDLRCARAAYYGLINFIDDQIGRFLQYTNQSKDTFVLFTADHGEMLGDHHLFRKTYPYEASARVPFFASAPREWGYPAEHTCDSAVGLQDVMPTLLDVAGVEIPDTCTGKSLLPIMRGEQSAVRDILHGEHASCYEKHHANHYLTDGHRKYIWHSQLGREQLFDLDADPHELHDLARDADAESQLAPWRQHLIEVLRDRPEHFVADGQLNPGQPHEALLPGYDAAKWYPFQ